jgi:hypothetical protein
VLLSLTVFLAALAVALREALRATDGRLVYALDDAYIHMAVARTLARHGLWGCTLFHFSSSSSSLLWTFALGAAYRVFGVHDSIPLVLNVALGIGTLLVANASLARFGVPPLPRASALVGIVVAFPMAGMVLMGMEHVLHLLLTIAFATVAVDALTTPAADERLARRRTVTLCLLGALLGASRYEGYFLVGLVCLTLVVRRQSVRSALVLSTALLPAVAFGAISVANGSYFLPNPLMIKAVGEKASTVSALLHPFGTDDLAFLRNDRAMPILLGLAVLVVLARGRVRRFLWRPPVVLSGLLAAMILLHGHYVFSPLYWAYRYDAYLIGFGLLVAAVVAVEMPTPRALPRGALPALAVALLLPFVADVREGLSPDAEIEGAQGTYLEQVQTAEFVRLYYPHAAVIVNDLGAVTYYTEARILDLVALGDMEPLAIMRRTGAYTSRDVTTWTSRYHPSIAIVSLGWSMVGPLIPHEWVRVAVVEEPPHHHRVGFYAVDRREDWTLRSRVAQHYGPLARARGYGVRLRRAEGLEEVDAQPPLPGAAETPPEHARPTPPPRG